MTQKVISFHYLLTNADGEKIDTSQGGAPFSFISGTGQIIPGLEKELIHLKIGDKKKISVAAHEAYGKIDESLKIEVPPDKLPVPDVKVGDRFRAGDGPHTLIYTVIGVDGEKITLDGNHPLAGQNLIFDVELIATRDATAQELEHGHSHGEHGHDH